ncbi:MAG: hypothetical protein H0Z28_04920 [Archaeoglobus sp.]|nr:hypothetical protein [Archaeoglobus sp.]
MKNPSEKNISGGWFSDKISREDFYKNIKPMDEPEYKFDSKILDYYDFVLRKKTTDLKELVSAVQEKKKTLQTYTSLALFSSVLSLMAVTMWLYQTGLISSPFLPFLASAALLALLNIFIGLKVRALLYG